MARRSTLALPKHLAAVGVPPFLSYCGFSSDGGRDDRMLRNPISGRKAAAGHPGQAANGALETDAVQTFHDYSVLVNVVLCMK